MALVYDVSADMAMFRKPYTTTSMVSFPFPPPTALAGLIGAIVGISHDAAQKANSAAFWDAMSGIRVGVGVKKPIAWSTTTVNLMKFKTPNAHMGEHIQVKHQFVKGPRYRVYVEGGNVYGALRERLEKGEFMYTPYLGIAYCIADWEYIGEYTSMSCSGKDLAVDTVVPVYGDLEVDVLASGGIHREVVPFRMSKDRKLEETVAVLYPEFRSDRKSVVIVRNRGDVDITQVGDDVVAWFKPW